MAPALCKDQSNCNCNLYSNSNSVVIVQISEMEHGLSLNDFLEMEKRKKFHSGWYRSREASELRDIIREEIVQLFVDQSKSDEERRRIEESDGMYGKTQILWYSFF